jgi:putative transposase
VDKVDEWRWSSCLEYYGKSIYATDLLDDQYILKMFGPEITSAQERFKEFNERINDDQCLEDI